jgi:PASTA domain
VSGGNVAGATVATSNAVGVASLVPPLNSARPRLSGAARVGQRLTCGAGTWSGGPSFAYRWLRNGAAIARATGSAYRLVSADVGKAVQCSVLATNGGGTVAADSAPRIIAQACIVPRLKGATLSSARSRLGRAHCALGKVTRAFSSSVKSGRVIRSNPGAAANLAAGTKVGLQLSRGPRPKKKS